MSLSESEESPATSLPQDYWLVEKSDNALKTLATLIDYVRQDHDVALERKESIIGHAGTVAHSVSKILAYALGSPAWTPDDPQVVREYGTAGYKYLVAKYRGGGQVYTIGWDEYWNRLEQLVSFGRTSRSQIHEITRFALVNDHRFKRIDETVESLVMGEISWERFVEIVQKVGGIR